MHILGHYIKKYQVYICHIFWICYQIVLSAEMHLYQWVTNKSNITYSHWYLCQWSHPICWCVLWCSWLNSSSKRFQHKQSTSCLLTEDKKGIKTQFVTLFAIVKWGDYELETMGNGFSKLFIWSPLKEIEKNSWDFWPLGYYISLFDLVSHLTYRLEYDI